MTDLPDESTVVPQPENRSFLLHPTAAGNGAVLLVHGFTASPWEMRPLGDFLCARGYAVLGVRLPGHGTSMADLATRNRHEWLTALDDAWQQLAQTHSRVYGVGLSTGALLLLELARNRPLAGLALLSPFLRLGNPLAGVAHLIAPLFPVLRHPVPEALTPFYYDHRPLRAIHQLHLLCRQVRQHLSTATTPALVIGGSGDRTAPQGSACSFFAQLGSRDKELHLFGLDTPHVLTTTQNPHAAEVFALIEDFIAEHEPASMPAGG